MEKLAFTQDFTSTSSVICTMCCGRVLYAMATSALGKMFCSLICADDFTERNPIERHEDELEEVED